MSNSTQRSVALTSLLPSSSYILAYSLPLLLTSIVLTFAGAFFTLDRTRSFPPRYDAIPIALDKKKAPKFYRLLQGGIGGLAIGYAFGAHLSTFLALLIPSTSSSASLGPKSFLAVWLLSAIATTFVAGRWQYAALAFSGISGGGTIAVSLSIIIHPSLFTRIILTGIFLPIIALLVILPLVKFQHGALRLSASATGAFGLVLSIALLSRVESWGNAWERLWRHDGESWGSGKEKGLSAAWCLFVTLGVVVDWLLKRKFGENPDQKWDQYLANYAANLPNYGDRAGTFQPLPSSLWGRIFGPQKRRGDERVSFPSDNDLKGPKAAGSTISNPLLSRSPRQLTFHPKPGFHKKGPPQPQIGKKRENVEFGNAYSDGSDSEDSDDLKDPSTPLTSENARPWKRSEGSNLSGSVTLNAAEDTKSGSEVLEYSDHEEDVTAHVERMTRRVSRDRPGWSPDFLAKHRNAASAGSSSHPTASPTVPPGAAPVPATPSLIKAMERVAVAQREAFGPQGQASPGLPEPNSRTGVVEDPMPTVKASKTPQGRRGAHWEEFWRDVKVKAGQR